MSKITAYQAQRGARLMMESSTKASAIMASIRNDLLSFGVTQALNYLNDIRLYTDLCERTIYEEELKKMCGDSKGV